MTRSWLRIEFASQPRAQAAAIAETLDRLGSAAVTITPTDKFPVFAEPSVAEAVEWQHAQVSALFDRDRPAIEAILRDHFPGPLEYWLEQLADRDWANAWREHFPPRRFAERLWVCPRDPIIPDDGLPVVRLDPGAAFGTGRHSTTALCLDAMCQWITPATRTVIDYGCGSGILAIAAAKLGVPTVCAIDIDPVAQAVARENAATNNVADRIEVIGPADLGSRQADLLVANILLGPLVALAATFQRLLSENGLVLVSGLLRDQVEPCLAVYGPLFNMHAPRYQDEWALLAGRRNDGL